MINQKAKFFVGLFIAAGISLAVITIIFLGMNRFLEKGQFYAVYFNESVQGLKIDSPVKYRGVAIGHIERISLAPDSKLIEVVLKIEADITLEENMVAQQKAVGITGSKFIELDLMSDSVEASSPDLKFPTEYRVLASRPSNISELFRSADDIIKKLNALDIVDISDSLKVTLHHLDQALQDFDAKGISGDIRTSLTDINKNFDPERWDKVVTGIEKSIGSLNEVFRNTNSLMANASGLIARTEAEVANLSRYILVVGQYLEKASSSLDQTLEQVSIQPSQLLFSEPPIEKEFEKNIK
ncbi:ABC-type transport system protein periplasmic component [Candidatus Scalindua japonica]|uniref:ABC-type transport system protein periplasmic component n=1 Tax=Candidatus Scalindua japonica TaxID=1284222 RepID=A0A286TZ19_9BACT|nr:MlaD family protein [Candidatus Scalindua japonica]GAX61108.1 ABC-type transport system protein periplasmic component [Candidatus Scalindua japonica]